MQKAEFEDKLRYFLRKEPFEPFVVEMLDGSVLRVERPSLVFNNGSAMYATEELEFTDFWAQQVRSIEPARREPVP